MNQLWIQIPIFFPTIVKQFRHQSLSWDFEDPMIVYSGYRFAAIRRYVGSRKNWGEGNNTMEDAVNWMGWKSKNLLERTYLQADPVRAQFFESLRAE